MPAEHFALHMPGLPTHAPTQTRSASPEQKHALAESTGAMLLTYKQHKHQEQAGGREANLHSR